MHVYACIYVYIDTVQYSDWLCASMRSMPAMYTAAAAALASVCQSVCQRRLLLTRGVRADSMRTCVVLQFLWMESRTSRCALALAAVQSSRTENTTNSEKIRSHMKITLSLENYWKAIKIVLIPNVWNAYASSYRYSHSLQHSVCFCMCRFTHTCVVSVNDVISSSRPEFKDV